MAIRQVGQLSLADSLAPQRIGVRLAEVDGLIDWGSVAALMSSLHASRSGAPAYPPLVMLKALLLQEWYALSDPQLEEALADRLSFRRFVGLALGDDVPDHSSISRFRSMIAASGLAARVFDEVTRQIDGRGLILRKGTMIDATLVEAQVRRPKPPKETKLDADLEAGQEAGQEGARDNARQTADVKKADTKTAGSKDAGAEATNAPAPRAPSKLVGSALDPDAAWAKKGGKRTFGYKGHVAVDFGSGVIRRAALTPASVADTTKADDMIIGDEEAVYGDKAYDTKTRRAGLKARRVKDRIAHRPNRHHPLTRRQEQRNDGIARRRAGVERVFAIAKCKMAWRRVRYRGLVRNAAHFLLICTAMNLERLRVLAAPAA